MGLTSEQIELRKNGIGSSDIAGVADLYPPEAKWGSRPITVYMDKKGLREFDGNWNTDKGDGMEPIIAKWYGKKVGAIKLTKGDTIEHKEENWIMATPDYYVEILNSPERMVEVKDVGRHMVRYWADGVPIWVQCQVHWQSIITGIRFLDVAASLEGDEPEVWQIEYSPEIQASLVEIGRDFWFEHVLKDIPPTPDGSQQYATYIKSTFKRHSRDVVRAPEEANQWVWQRTQAMADMEKAEYLKTEAENRLKLMVGENAGVWNPHWRATWVRTSSGGIDWKGLATDLMKEHGVTKKLLEKHTRPGNRQFQVRERRDAT